MLTLPLDPTDDRANPVFKDEASCAQWLSQLQLTNLKQAHRKLLTQIDELNRYPMRGLVRFNTLELLRETVGHIQNDLAKKLIDKPLPLSEGELATLTSITQLWQAMVTGYQRGLQTQLAGDKQLADHGAVLCHRCLLYSGMEIYEHLRTGYDFNTKLWLRLHELYGYAEQQGFHLTEVADPLSGHTAGNNCVGSYVKTLLSCYANPAQLTHWQMQHMDHWLSLWSDAVTLDRSYTRSKSDAQPLAIDLSGTRGLQPVEGLPHSDTMRYLEMVPLSKLLRVKTILLKQGQTPQQVGLGDQFNTHDCLELLVVLHQRWCENKHKRASARRDVSLNTTLCCTPEGIFAHLTGKPFKQRDVNIYSLTRVESTETMQPIRELIGMGYPLEDWQMKNESVTGACLTRDGETGERLRCKQLIALRPDNAKFYMLGAIAWARVMQNGKLQLGVKYLPGRPDPVRIHIMSINPSTSKNIAPAFLLPALPPLKTPASLIIPRGWFAPRRMIEVTHPDGKSLTVQLGISVESGLDYERVSFTIKG
jgi:hypothetical protein